MEKRYCEYCDKYHPLSEVFWATDKGKLSKCKIKKRHNQSKLDKARREAKKRGPSELEQLLQSKAWEIK